MSMKNQSHKLWLPLIAIIAIVGITVVACDTGTPTVTYSVTFLANGGMFEQFVPARDNVVVPVVRGNAVNPPVYPVRYGHHVRGWFTIPDPGPEAVSVVFPLVITGNTHLFAGWEEGAPPEEVNWVFDSVEDAENAGLTAVGTVFAVPAGEEFYFGNGLFVIGGAGREIRLGAGGAAGPFLQLGGYDSAFARVVGVEGEFTVRIWVSGTGDHPPAEQRRVTIRIGEGGDRITSDCEEPSTTSAFIMRTWTDLDAGDGNTVYLFTSDNLRIQRIAFVDATIAVHLPPLQAAVGEAQSVLAITSETGFEYDVSYWAEPHVIADFEDAIGAAQGVITSYPATTNATVQTVRIALMAAKAEFRLLKVPGRIDDPTNLEPLEQALAAAGALLPDTVTSTLGIGLSATQYWARQIDINALNSAIATAQAERDNPTNQATINTALRNLNAARETFINERRLGVPSTPSWAFSGPMPTPWNFGPGLGSANAASTYEINRQMPHGITLGGNWRFRLPDHQRLDPNGVGRTITLPAALVAQLDTLFIHGGGFHLSNIVNLDRLDAFWPGLPRANIYVPFLDEVGNPREAANPPTHRDELNFEPGGEDGRNTISIDLRGINTDLVLDWPWGGDNGRDAPGRLIIFSISAYPDIIGPVPPVGVIPDTVTVTGPATVEVGTISSPFNATSTPPGAAIELSVALNANGTGGIPAGITWNSEVRTLTVANTVAPGTTVHVIAAAVGHPLVRHALEVTVTGPHPWWEDAGWEEPLGGFGVTTFQGTSAGDFTTEHLAQLGGFNWVLTSSTGAATWRSGNTAAGPGQVNDIQPGGPNRIITATDLPTGALEIRVWASSSGGAAAIVPTFGPAGHNITIGGQSADTVTSNVASTGRVIVGNYAVFTWNNSPGGALTFNTDWPAVGAAPERIRIAAIGVYRPTQGARITINFADLVNRAPGEAAINDGDRIEVSLGDGDFLENGAAITVADPQGTIRWFLGSDELTGTGPNNATLTLTRASLGTQVGERFLTVGVMRDGRLYGTRLAIEVTL